MRLDSMLARTGLVARALPAFVMTVLAVACSGQAIGDPVQTSDASPPDGQQADGSTTDAQNTDSSSVDAPALGTTVLRFKNNTSRDVYVQWAWGEYPEPTVRDATHPDEYSLTQGCTPSCSPICTCMYCDMAPPRAKKVVAGSLVEYWWKGDYFDLHPCGDSTCQCHEAHVALAGTYQVELDCALGLRQGAVSSTDPTVFDSAWLDDTKQICGATGSFEIGPEGGVTEVFFQWAEPET